MNLVAYDKIDNNSNESKLYLSNKYPYIITREVKYRQYYCFVKKYEPSIDDTIFYLVLLDDKPLDRNVSKTRKDNYGRLKFNISTLVNKNNIFKNGKINISLSLETQADDGDIYRLDIVSD